MKLRLRTLKRAILNESGAARLWSRHPWIFRGNLAQIPVSSPGELTAISERNGGVLAWGLWSDTALCLRVLSYGPKEPDVLSLVRLRAKRALEARRSVAPNDENAFRWIHGESDFLPGVTADVYDGTVVLQLTAIGWYKRAREVAEILAEVGGFPNVILRDDTKYTEKEGIPKEIKALVGRLPDAPLEINCGGIKEFVDVARGQKTGTYLDVRHIPAMLDGDFSGSRVLDCFSYQGRFSLRAASRSAASVTLIDQSREALDVAEKNFGLNGLPLDNVEFRCGNAFEILRELDAKRARFDVVIMDPPPFAPTRAQIEPAKRGYKELAVRGLRRLSRGGKFVFMSCSHAFSRETLLETLRLAAGDVGVDCRIVREIHQPFDHPVLAAVPESDYLKGFIAEVIE